MFGLELISRMKKEEGGKGRNQSFTFVIKVLVQVKLATACTSMFPTVLSTKSFLTCLEGTNQLFFNIGIFPNRQYLSYTIIQERWMEFSNLI